jgi:hypothetical protein
MKSWVVDVTYTSRGRAYLQAETREEAEAKAEAFDFESDEVIESDFDDVEMSTLEENK